MRLRNGHVIRDPGYDGHYGQIHLFHPEELRSFLYGDLLQQQSQKEKHKPKHSATQNTTPPIRPSKTDQEQHSRSDTTILSPPIAANTPIAENTGLDDDQNTLVTITDRPLLIIAGPGSGKTRLLTHWITHVLTEHKDVVSPCLAITFSRRAGEEIRERLAMLRFEDTMSVVVHTFHSFGLSILRTHGHYGHLPADFFLADAVTCRHLLVTTLGISERKARTLAAAISKTKRTKSMPSKTIIQEWDGYHQAMARRHWIDFDDVIILAEEILTRIPAEVYPCFKAIAVDEFQDIDAVQYRLLRRIRSSKTSLCVIGDPDQAIYSFRGANANYFTQFQEDYPDTLVSHLSRNYRSGKTIITASNQVMGTSKMQAIRHLDEPIICHTAATERAEAEFIVHTIEQLLGGHTFFSIDSDRVESAGDLGMARSFSDIAILYRTDALASPICQALKRSGIPFHKYDHVPLIHQPAIKRLLNAMEHDHESDDVSLAVRLRDAAKKLLSMSEHDRAIGKEEANSDDDSLAIDSALQHLLSLADRHNEDLTRFRDAVALSTATDLLDARAERVSLLTLHAVKGLEFRVVFIAGLEDGILPLIWGRADPDHEAEERRLFYVGMTRAQDRLILSRALSRHWRGKIQQHKVSRFFLEIEQALIQSSHSQRYTNLTKSKQLNLW